MSRPRARIIIAALAVILSGGVARAEHASEQPTSAYSRPPDPHQAPFVDLMTFGVGEVVFEKFGHAAICLRYREASPGKQGGDTTCFNFGVSDLHEGPSMIWDFLRGTKEFWVEPLSYGGMLAFYEAEDRDIFVQTLPLTDDQARTLENRLWSSLDGPGSRYHYDHFFENCSTRIRDVIDDITHGALRAAGDTEYPLTFRELGQRGLASMPALIVLADFVGGSQLEDHPTLWQAMFHPEILRGEIQKRLGPAPKLVYARKGEPFPTAGSTGRLVMTLFGLLFALPIAIARTRGRIRLGVVAGFAIVLAIAMMATFPPLWSSLGAIAFAFPALFAIGGAAALHPRRGETFAIAFAALWLFLWGLTVWGLVAVSPIPMLGWNELVFVVAPTDLVLPLLRPRWRRGYARVRIGLIVLASLLCAIGVLRQPLWVPILIAFMPLALIAFDPRAPSTPPP